MNTLTLRIEIYVTPEDLTYLIVQHLYNAAEHGATYEQLFDSFKNTSKSDLLSGAREVASSRSAEDLVYVFSDDHDKSREDAHAEILPLVKERFFKGDKNAKN